MTINPLVMKFGGTSVRDAQAFARVARIVRTRRERHPVVVVSAMSRVTDALVASTEAARAASLKSVKQESVEDVARRIFREILEEHFMRHTAVAEELLPSAALETFRVTLNAAHTEIEKLLATLLVASASMHGLLQDTIISHGERLSSALLTHVLEAHELPARFVDARRCIVTDDRHGEAEPHIAETERATIGELIPLVKAHLIPVVGGFIGATQNGATTTLGRNGSDFSAALIGGALRASVVEIWTDTPGVLTADPRLVPAARNVPRLSYKEAADLSRAGAKVLHPKTIGPLIEHGVPLHVRNSQAFEESGTAIFAGAATPGAKSISLKRGLTIVQVTPALAGDDALFVELVCHATIRHREDLDLSLVSHAGALFVAHDEAAASVAAEVESGATVCVERHRALITIIGERMNTAADTHARTLSALGTANIAVIAHGTSTTGRSFVIEDRHAADALAQLHKDLFEL